MPFPNEHACRVEDPDQYDEFRRENDAAEVLGRMVDHIFGIEGEVNADLQSVRYPLDNGWDGEEGLLDAQEHCQDIGGLEFEPAEGTTDSASACVACGTHGIHDSTMTHPDSPDVKTRTVHATGVVTRELDDEEREVLRVPISSTRPDRDGDRFDKAALGGMASQIKDEQPLVFDNHGLAGGWMEAIPYDARETIGTQFDAEVTEADDGEHDLFAFVNPDGTHPEGERMMKQVDEENQAIKFSVGFGIKGYDEREEVEDDYEGDGKVFTAADLMETSRVGIPANPDASVSTASAKSGGVAPGYAMHPLAQLFGTAPAQTDADMPTAAKSAGDDPETDSADADSSEVDALREQVQDLAATVGDLAAQIETLDASDTKQDECDGDDDCPDGKVCIDGECVDEDEMMADAAEHAELRARIEELEAAKEDLGEPDTKDTDTEPTDPTEQTADPDDTSDGDTDDVADSGPASHIPSR